MLVTFILSANAFTLDLSKYFSFGKGLIKLLRWLRDLDHDHDCHCPQKQVVSYMIKSELMTKTFNSYSLHIPCLCRTTLKRSMNGAKTFFSASLKISVVLLLPHCKQKADLLCF